MKELKIGQRVRIKGRNYVMINGPQPGMIGTVICNVYSTEYGIEFDKPFGGGHSCSGKGKKGHCWNF